jgi:calcium-dependent protein kinase
MVMDVDNVVPPAKDDPQGRRRFLSYASGASTPNTSQANISVDDGPESGVSRQKPNPKLLQSSGSKINLDELHSSDGAGLSSKVVRIEFPFGMPIEEIYDGVHDGRVLGSGTAGIVRLVTHKKTLIQYAVKCLDLGLVSTKEDLAQLREEVFIMSQLDHPNIVRLEGVYETQSAIYLVQELCLGGELFDRLDEQPDYCYTEAECARLVKQMLSAVRYLHSKGIVHRDLKLENFLFSNRSDDSELKMIDFGFSKHFVFGEILTAPVGTPYTVAPEVIHGSYDEQCDVWAIGVIAFLLLSGNPPFGGCGGPESMMKVRDNILSCKYAFEPQDIWEHVSEKGKDFIRHMLVVDPKMRPTAKAAQKDPWLQEWASRSRNKEDTILSPNVVKALVSFKEFSHVRKMFAQVLSFTLLPDQIAELRKEFETLDTDGSGEISLAGLKQVLVTNAGTGWFGAMTEKDAEDIFDAMRVNKAETRIHWHEFIAAGRFDTVCGEMD